MINIYLHLSLARTRIHPRQKPPPGAIRALSEPRFTMLGIVALLGILLTGCNPAPTGPSPSSSTNAPDSATTVPASPVPATTAAAAVYKPATAQGPAQNVPVPVLPDKAKEFSKEGLEEFARYWYSTLGYLFETGDTDPLLAISAVTCRTCANVSGPIGDWYLGGGWITGGQMTVHSTNSNFYETPEGTYQAILMIQQSAVSYFNKDTTLKQGYPQRIARADILVAAFADGSWTAKTAEHLTKD